MKKHVIHVLELTLTFAHTTKIEHATEHKPNSRGATRLTARERPWSTNRCRGRSHKVLKVRLPEELEEARVLEEGDVRGAACGTEVSLLAAGGWRVARAAPHAQQDFGRRFAAAWGAGAAGVWSRVMSQAGPGRPVAPAQRRRPVSMCVSRVTCGRVCQRVCTGGVADGGVELLR